MDVQSEIREQPTVPGHVAPPVQGAVQLDYVPARLRPPVNWPAVAGFLCGLLLFVPVVPGLAALRLGRQGLRRSDEDPAFPDRRLASAARALGRANLVVWAVVALAAPFWWVFVGREMVNRRRCASNLRYIGYGIQIYANEHSGTYPRRLADLLAYWPEMSPDTLICPSTDDVPAPGLTPAARAAAAASGRHCSYIYQLIPPPTPFENYLLSSDLIVVHEPLENHRGAGMHVLFADGHIEWYGRDGSRQLLDDLKSGRRRSFDPATVQGTGDPFDPFKGSD